MVFFYFYFTDVIATFLSLTFLNPFIQSHIILVLLISLTILNIFRIFDELLYKISFSLNDFSFLLLIFVILVSLCFFFLLVCSIFDMSILSGNFGVLLSHFSFYIQLFLSNRLPVACTSLSASTLHVRIWYKVA